MNRLLLCIALVLAGVSCIGGGSSGNGLPVADSLALAEGLNLYEEGEFAAARERLAEGARSGDGHIRAESFLYLNALEMELGNYDAARPWLARYHAEVTQLSVDRAVARVNRRHNMVLVGIGIIVAVSVLAGAVYVRRRQSPKKHPKPLAPSEWTSYLADADTFRGTAIYAEIVGLAGQKPGREARVLSLSRQEVLDSELAAAFPGFAARLRDECPALTDGDVKLCCLSLAGLSSFGRAICFGSTETNIVKQRKHHIKKKMDTGSGIHSLFEFIFEPRI